MKTLFFILFCVGLGQNFSLAQTKDWKSYKTKKFKISYPAQWDFQEMTTGQFRFAILSPATSKEDLFRENINLIEQNLKGKGIDLDKYVEISETQVISMLKNAKVLKSERIKQKKVVYHKLVYMGLLNGAALHFEQYAFIKKEIAYVLTFTCESAQWETYESIKEQIMQSFKLK